MRGIRAQDSAKTRQRACAYSSSHRERERGGRLSICIRRDHVPMCYASLNESWCRPECDWLLRVPFVTMSGCIGRRDWQHKFGAH